MATTKMTQKDYFNAIIKLAEENDRQDIVDFAKGRIEMLDRKSTSKKKTATQKTNEEIKKRILEVLTENDIPLTCTGLIETGRFEDFEIRITNQKMSALLSQLVKAGNVEKTIEKRVSFFSLA